MKRVLSLYTMVSGRHSLRADRGILSTTTTTTTTTQSLRQFSLLRYILKSSDQNGKKSLFKLWIGEHSNKQSKKNVPFPPPKGQKPPESNYSKEYILMAVVACLYFLQVLIKGKSIEVSWQYFVKEMLQKGEVDKLEVLASRDTVLVTLHPGAVINGKKEPHPIGHYYYFTINNPDTLER